MTIQRLRPSGNQFYAQIVPADDGAYVRYTDHLAAIQRERECREKLAAALKDAAAGLRYVKEMHGELYGVGFDRVETNGQAALAAAKEME